MHSKNRTVLTQCGLGPRFDPASGDHVIHLFAGFPLFLFFLRIDRIQILTVAYLV